MKMNFISMVGTVATILSLYVICAQKTDCSAGHCGFGHKLQIDGNCAPCDAGSFMNLDNHRCRSCFRCSKPRENEVVKQICTLVKDATIECKSGWYMNGVNVPEARYCSRCRACWPNEVIQQCSEQSNTICGNLPVSNKSSEKIQEPSTFENMTNSFRTISPPSVSTSRISNNFMKTGIIMMIVMAVVVIIILTLILWYFRAEVKLCYILVRFGTQKDIPESEQINLSREDI